MLRLIRLFLGSLVGLFSPRAEMAAENLALRHQLGILRRSRPARLPLTSWDRALWAFVLRRFPGWRRSLVIVRPETVIAWHRRAFRLFWRRKSQAGRPKAQAEVRRLIREMASDNPTWGAPRIHGELLKLGFDVSVGAQWELWPVLARTDQRFGHYDPSVRAHLDRRLSPE